MAMFSIIYIGNSDLPPAGDDLRQRGTSLSNLLLSG